MKFLLKDLRYQSDNTKILDAAYFDIEKGQPPVIIFYNAKAEKIGAYPADKFTVERRDG